MVCSAFLDPTLQIQVLTPKKVSLSEVANIKGWWNHGLQDASTPHTQLLKWDDKSKSLTIGCDFWYLRKETIILNTAYCLY